MAYTRTSDYMQLGIWAVTLVFSLGVLYHQINTNTMELERREVYIQHQESMAEDITTLKLQQVYQRNWQSEFMVTFKELVGEIKKTNSEVLRQSYQLRAVEKEFMHDVDI
jgi:hypothetical protein